MKLLLCIALSILLAGLGGCGSTPPAADSASPQARTSGDAKTPRGGGYYLDDGPGDNPPPNLDQIADAQPRIEPLNRLANRPYTALGRNYTPAVTVQAFHQRGVASWYGKRFHGLNTSSGEPYDMYGMTAAHPTLPIPSYARVTNLDNGRSAIVRINDRGPFLHERVIDLSFAAAYKLGYASQGSANVTVDAIVPGDDSMLAKTTAPTGADNTGTAQPYLQLGAFGSRENAENFRTQMAERLRGIVQNLAIVLNEGLFRVHAGPYASDQEAASAAARIRNLIDLQPRIVLR